MSYKIRRIAEKNFSELLSNNTSRDVILVQGARQVGKTTLVEQVLAHRPKVFALNLERDLDALRGIDRTQSFADFTRFLQMYLRAPNFDVAGSILFIDEAQESQHLGRYVRFMKEEWRHVQVILSGSSMSRIFRDDTRVPVGRIRPWLVTPLSFEDFLSVPRYAHLHPIYQEFVKQPRAGLIEGETHAAFLRALDEYFVVGGLPAVAMSYFDGGDFRAVRRAIYDSQEDDFVRKSQITERSHFASGMRGVANFLGMPSKYSHIHESKTLAEKTLGALRAWYLVIEIEQKSAASTSQHLPKRYLYDLGIAQDLREMPFPRLSTVATQNPALRTQLGGLFENALLLSILADQARLGDLSGWRKAGSDSPELDFVWRWQGTNMALECKATLKTSMKHWSSLKAYLETVNGTGARTLGILVSAAPFEHLRTRAGELVNLPLYLASGAVLQHFV